MPHAGPEPHSASAEFLPYQYAITPWPPSSVPLLTASIRSKALTTAPAGSSSIFKSPPDMAFTLATKSPANSWKMSLVGQVLCQRMVTGPCAFTIAGNPIAAAPAAAPAAPPRKPRRETPVFLVLDAMSVSVCCVCVTTREGWPGGRWQARRLTRTPEESGKRKARDRMWRRGRTLRALGRAAARVVPDSLHGRKGTGNHNLGNTRAVWGRALWRRQARAMPTVNSPSSMSGASASRRTRSRLGRGPAMPSCAVARVGTPCAR
ncbi:hypothetical protein D3C72_1214360 [compost metagenome]